MKKLISIMLVVFMLIPMCMFVSADTPAVNINTVYVSDSGNDNAEGTDEFPVKTMERAYEMLGMSGGTILIKGTYTQRAYFFAPVHVGKITIKGADENAVFKNASGGVRFFLGGETEFADLKIDISADMWMVVCNFHDCTVAGSVKMTRSKKTFILAGGQGDSDSNKNVVEFIPTDVTLTVDGGDWEEVIGSVRNNLSTPSQLMDASDYDNIDVTINIGTNAGVSRIAAFSRSFDGPFWINASCTLNLNGGRVTSWIGASDSKAEYGEGMHGYYKGFTINMSDGFDMEHSFTDRAADTDTHLDINGVFFGISGDSVWANEDTEYSALSKTKLVLDKDIYDRYKDSSFFRGVSVYKEGEVPEDPKVQIEIPAEPTVDTSVPTYYIAYEGWQTTKDGDKSGKDASNPLPSKGWGEGGIIYEAAKDGAIFVIEQKGYAGAAFAEITPSKPVVFTSLDPADGVSNIAKNPDGTYNTSADGLGQFGMFMKDAPNDGDAEKSTISFRGPVIFKDTVILNRKATTPIYQVENGGLLVIASTCDIIVGADGVDTPCLFVEEGGYAYLHNAGFSYYMGDGVIVVDSALLDSGEVSLSQFEYFRGTIVDETGTVIYDATGAHGPVVEISDKYELDAIRDNPLGKYILTEDIIFTEEDYETGAFFEGGWKPIDWFEGELDGNGHTIKGLMIHSNSDNMSGLFGALEDATVKNLVLSDVKYDTENPLEPMMVGGIAGVAFWSDISNCYVSGSIDVVATGVMLGGIVGWSAESAISGCANVAAVNARATSEDYCMVGGIAGDASTGGSTGPVYSYISDCYNAGSVTGYGKTIYIGGVSGNGLSAKFENCYNLGTVVISGPSSHTIKGQGGFLGNLYTSTVTMTNCYYLSGIAGVGNNSGVGTAIDLSELSRQETFAGFDFENTWTIADAHPQLRCFYDAGEGNTSDGAMKDMWISDGNGSVYIDAAGTVITNSWLRDGDNWRYAGEDGYALKNTWKQDSVGWCYLGSNGNMAKNLWVRDSVGWCFVGADGYIVKGQWISYLEGWYFVDADGYRASNCWMADTHGWCYLGEYGRMLTNTWVMDSVGWCYVGDDGYCVTNTWMADSKGWCYLDSEGRMVTDAWVKDSIGWCYIGSEGYMLTNAWVMDSVGWCYVGADGYCVTNAWKQDSQGWCYLDENGRMLINDWAWDGSMGKWCWIDENGYWNGTVYN